MIKLKIKDIADITGGRLFSKDEESIVKRFSTDTRTLRPGDIFIAIKGDSFDGHDFIEEARKKGAAGLVLEHYDRDDIEDSSKHVIVVEDSIKAMGKIAKHIRERFKLPVICITGTNGKTTVKDITAHILSKRLNILKNKKSFNNTIGLSLTLFELDESYDAAILELGSNHPGEIAYLAKIASATLVIITNIGRGHLEHFLTKQGVFVEKTSILDFLPESGIAFLNGDDEFLKEVKRSDKNIKFFGKNKNNDFRIEAIKSGDAGCNFILDEQMFHIPLEGEHNVYNATASILAAKSLGLKAGQIREALLDVKLPDMRLEKVTLNEITFINDAYNANPDSFECALRVLEESKTQGKKGIVAGDMFELGAESDELHKKIGESIANKKIDFLIAMGEKAKYIVQGAVESGMPKEMAYVASGHEDAVKMLKKIAGANDIVLIKGSRASKMEEILKCFTTFYTR